MRNSEVIRKFKRRLVHAFYELAHKQVDQPDPMAVLSDPAAMRGLLLTYTEKVIALESKVAEQETTVVAFRRIAASDGSLTLRQSAKALQQPERKFTQWLHAQDWTYRHGGGSWLGYADKTKAGLLTHKVYSYLDEKSQEDKVAHQVRITPKGLAKLAEMLGVDLHSEAEGESA